MKDLEFTPSDFTAAPTGNADGMAMWVNKKLARKIDKAETVYISEDSPPPFYRDISFLPEFAIAKEGKGLLHPASHRAKLVCIEKIKK